MKNEQSKNILECHVESHLTKNVLNTQKWNHIRLALVWRFVFVFSENSCFFPIYFHDPSPVHGALGICVDFSQISLRCKIYLSTNAKCLISSGQTDELKITLPYADSGQRRRQQDTYV